MSASRIEYSEKYADDDNEYRCVEVLVFGEIKNAMIRAFWLILSSLYLSIQMLFLRYLDMSFSPRNWPSRSPRAVC